MLVCLLMVVIEYFTNQKILFWYLMSIVFKILIMIKHNVGGISYSWYRNNYYELLWKQIIVEWHTFEESNWQTADTFRYFWKQLLLLVLQFSFNCSQARNQWCFYRSRVWSWSFFILHTEYVGSSRTKLSSMEKIQYFLHHKRDEKIL